MSKRKRLSHTQAVRRQAELDRVARLSANRICNISDSVEVAQEIWRAKLRHLSRLVADALGADDDMEFSRAVERGDVPLWCQLQEGGRHG